MNKLSAAPSQVDLAWEGREGTRGIPTDRLLGASEWDTRGEEMTICPLTEDLAHGRRSFTVEPRFKESDKTEESVPKGVS